MYGAVIKQFECAAIQNDEKRSSLSAPVSFASNVSRRFGMDERSNEPKCEERMLCACVRVCTIFWCGCTHHAADSFKRFCELGEKFAYTHTHTVCASPPPPPSNREKCDPGGRVNDAVLYDAADRHTHTHTNTAVCNIFTINSSEHTADYNTEARAFA